MIQGTSSNVGKSILTAAILRIMRNDGINAAPFKAQNMALNSFVTKDGGEIGRAQALQAEASGIEPTIHMNPILLKPTSDKKAQIIIHGKIYRNMSASEYHKFKKEVKRYVMESYKKLVQRHDVIVIEGAGSPAEINLKENDIANMGLAKMLNTPVVLVGDIDRGGVFASIIGTMELLTASERKRVKGLIINKFRGDMRLLKSGLDFLEKRTGIPVLGVVPYIADIILPDEDGAALETVQNVKRKTQNKGKINISVIKLPRISNFTDFDAFRFEPDVNIRYAVEPDELDGADIVIIPGSKNTIEDLKWMRNKGIAKKLIDIAENSGRIIGICGGLQMLGKSVEDPYSVETGLKRFKGLGLFDMATVLERKKNTYQVEAKCKTPLCRAYNSDKGFLNLQGYEIHMGKTNGSFQPFSIITNRNGKRVSIRDGAVSSNGKVWGTYIHGLFDSDRFRTDFLNEIRNDKGLPLQKPVLFIRKKNKNLDRLAKVVKDSLDIKKLYTIMELKTPS